MLKLLRKKKVAKRIFYVLAAIIIPAFVIWGSASVINKDKTPDYAGLIFGKKISFDAFNNAVFAWKTQLALQYGDKAEEFAKTFFDPAQAAWDRLIILHEARRRGIKVNDAQIIGYVTSLPFLQKNGNFDPQAYDLFLKYSLRVNPRTFEEQMRENLSMALVYDEITKNVSVSDEEIKEEYEKANVQARVKYVFFPSSGYKDKVSVKDEEIQAYYDKHKEKFKIPPQINAAYISLEFKEDASEDEKNAAAEKAKSAFSLAGKKGIKEAAKQMDLETRETGLFGAEDPIPALGWIPQLSISLFDLQPGSLSSIVETGRGFYIFEIKEKKNAYIPDFKEVKDKARELLINEKSRELAGKKAKDFLDTVKQASSFEKKAQESKLEAKETPFFSQDSYIAELGMAKPLKDAAFKIAKDEIFPDPIELEQGFYCIKVIGIVPFNEEKFKKDKDEFSNIVLEQKRNKTFNEFFEKLRKEAKLVSYQTFPR